MTAIAHFVAISCYLGAAALAATPFARPVGAPVRGVVALLGARRAGASRRARSRSRARRASCRSPGSGPSLSFAGLRARRDAARRRAHRARREPHARRRAARGGADDLRQPHRPRARRRAAGCARRVAVRAHRAELRRHRGVRAPRPRRAACTSSSDASSSRGGSARSIRFFPPLATLDRVNHVAAIAGWLGLTLGVVLAVDVLGRVPRAEPAEGRSGRWARGSRCRRIALGRVAGGWQARRAAIYSSVSFAAVVAAVRRVPRGGDERRGTLPVSGVPILVEGSRACARSSWVAAPVAARKARGARSTRARRSASSRRSRRRSCATLARAIGVDARSSARTSAATSATRCSSIAATDDRAMNARVAARRARAATGW